MHYTAEGNEDDQAYGPTDTRVISVSNALCERVQFNTTKSPDGYRVSLYRLNSRPKLTGHKTYSLLNERPSFLFDEYQFYYSYMPKGSKVNMSACLLQPNQDIAFYMIKGSTNFRRWKTNYGHYIHQIQINESCGKSNSTYSYTVPSDDFYYLVFDSLRTASNTLNISMYFEHTQYEVDDNTVDDHCSQNTSPFLPGYCSLEFPFSGSYILLQVAPIDSTAEIDWKFSVSIDIGCSPRVWMYFMISLSVLIAVVAILVMFLCLYCICCTKRTVTANTAQEQAHPCSEAHDAPLLHEVAQSPMNSTEYD